MPLNLTVNDGDFTPYLKYNAKAGRFYIRGDNGEVEVEKPKLAFDFANIKTGWIYFDPGTGPHTVWDSPGQTAPRPEGPNKYKRGFKVCVYSSELGEREFMSSATNCIAAILNMYEIYEHGAKSNPGKSPVYQCVGVKSIVGQHGTNYEPTFVLSGWVKVPSFISSKRDERNPPPMDEFPDDGEPIPF